MVLFRFATLRVRNWVFGCNRDDTDTAIRRRAKEKVAMTRISVAAWLPASRIPKSRTQRYESVTTPSNAARLRTSNRLCSSTRSTGPVRSRTQAKNAAGASLPGKSSSR